MCLADIRLITAITVMRKDTNGLLASISRLVTRLDVEGKNPDTTFFNRGYSLMSVIGALHSKWVSVFGTTRDFELNYNNKGPFILNDDKDGPKIL